MRSKPPKLHLKLNPPKTFNKKTTVEPSVQSDIEARTLAWVDSLKKQARDNLNKDFEYLRISWTSKFKIPRYQSFNDYTPEEIILETWEQFYFEHPDSLELKGINKKKNTKTGYTYYSTGDALLDQFEEAFGRGETPDLSALNNSETGKDIFREPVFTHTEHVVGGDARPGDVVIPRKGFEGVQENEKGEKITVAGAKIQHEDYSSEEWLKKALQEDPGLKAIADKIGVNDANI